MSLLTNVLGIADTVTKGLALQTTVTFERFLSSDQYGESNYATAVTLKVVAELKQKSVLTQAGELSVSSATLTFLDLAALLAATPVAPLVDGSLAGVVSIHDRITIMGRVQPILNVGGFVDGGTGRLIPTEIYLG